MRVTDDNVTRNAGVFGGLWEYLITRSNNRFALERERERNRAYAEHRDHLVHDAELVDYQDHRGGRILWIRAIDSGRRTTSFKVAVDSVSARETR